MTMSIKKTFFCLLAALLLALCTPGLLPAGMQSAVQDLENLIADDNRNQFRSHWLDLAGRFQQELDESQDGNDKARALYYLGRTYQELGKKSFLPSDFEKAEEFYTRAVREHPDTDFAGRSQYRKAEIHLNHHRDSAQAYLEYLRVVYNHSSSSKKDAAQEVLKELDRKNLEMINGKRASLDLEKVSEPQKSPQVSLEERPLADSRIEEEPGQEQSKTDSRTARLVDIRHWSSDEYTRIVLDLDSQVDYYHKLLKPDEELGTPHRLFIDLEKTRQAEEVTQEENVADGILSRIRSAQHTTDKSRVVLDIDELDDFRVFALENPFRIVVDVYSPDERQVLQTVEGEPDISLDPERAELSSGSLLEQLGLKVQTIMIDPGHGGKDPGAVVGNFKEKDIALRMSKVLGRKLEQEGFDVLYTRTEDVFVPLEERTAMANSQKADLFISVHANAHRNQNVRGFEVYYLNFAQDEDAKRVAARENAVSTQKISDLQYILTDLMLSSKISESRDLAKKVHEVTLDNTRGMFSDMDTNGVRQAPFYVLMGAQMPAILLEMGYMTNQKDMRLLQNDDFMQYMARGLTKGVTSYRDKIEQFARLD
ncbi:N-acetylmuramoyl-L-alanine amidase [Desulfonatronospira thiodismutans ASO3-1]|uniref:N-acetylmuramoyl-L-alanine amidase n=2 Tax=Desulfonatronospira thiodismutans TaxID=488939 RepID=D6SP94_9BACT|nr:N-acetylmuramoyl-L-alanine amidase [Desulfonatronospira thiodismutans ASO3-1]